MSKSTPQADGFYLAPSYAPHARTLLLWPTACHDHPYALEPIRDVIAAIAPMIAQYEPVTVIARPDQIAEVSLRCGEGVAILGLDYHDDDLWIGDTGPSMLVNASGDTAGLMRGLAPSDLMKSLAERLAIKLYKSPLNLHAGLFESNGQGSLLLYCDSDQQGYPIYPSEVLEGDLALYLGAQHIIPVTSSLSVKEGGHLDQVARFATPNTVLFNQPDNDHRLQFLQFLYDEEDLTLIPVPKPRHSQGSYLDFYLCNGALWVPSFEDPHDARAGEIIGSVFPDHGLYRPGALSGLHLGFNRLTLAHYEATTQKHAD